MNINLNKLNLSLDTFNNIASGTYNIGEVQLTADGQGLAKVNNHKNTWFFSNNTSISMEEALAIKNAFVQALSNSGVQPEALAAIRERLGIVDSLKSLQIGNVTPLSRQEIREIIDQNAAAINAKREQDGMKALKTSEQLYARMSHSTREAHQAIRAQRNEELASSRKVVINQDVKNLMTILSGKFAGKQDESGDLVKMGLSMRSALATLPGNKGQTFKIGEPMVVESKGTIQVVFSLDDNRFYNVDTKLTEQEFIKQMKTVPTPDSWEYLGGENEAVEKMTDHVCNEIRGVLDRLNDEEKTKTRDLVKNIFRENFQDKEVTSLLAKWLDNLLITGTRELRSEASLREKVDALKENVATLRKLDNTYPGAFDAGIEALNGNRGKAFNSKHFLTFLELAKQFDFGQLAASTKPSLDDIHNILLSTLEKRQQLKLPYEEFQGQDERMAARAFIMKFAMMKLDPQVIKDIRATLMSEDFGNLYRIYSSVSDGEIKGERGFEIRDTKIWMKAADLAGLADQLNLLICKEYGITDDADIPFPKSVPNPATGISDDILNTFKPQQANPQQANLQP